MISESCFLRGYELRIFGGALFQEVCGLSLWGPGIRRGGWGAEGGPRERSPVTAPPRAPRAGATVDTGFLSEALVSMAGFRKLTWA